MGVFRMTPIDIEAYRPRVSDAPLIAFRRTVQDRKPAIVVARPNDGPGPMRLQFAREPAKLQAADGMRAPPNQSPAYAAHVSKVRQEFRLKLLAFIATHSTGVNGRDCISQAPGRNDYVNKMLQDLDAAGLISRVYNGGGKGIVNTITDAGRALLDGAQ